MTDTLMSDLITENLKNNKILSYFNKMLYGIGTERCKNFHPDINGYCLIFLLAPHLSGVLSEEDNSLKQICNDTILLGTDITPSTVDVKVSEIPTHSGAIQYSTQVENSNKLQINYIANSNLEISSLHIR